MGIKDIPETLDELKAWADVCITSPNLGLFVCAFVHCFVLCLFVCCLLFERCTECAWECKPD